MGVQEGRGLGAASPACAAGCAGPARRCVLSPAGSGPPGAEPRAPFALCRQHHIRPLGSSRGLLVNGHLPSISHRRRLPGGHGQGQVSPAGRWQPVLRLARSRSSRDSGRSRGLQGPPSPFRSLLSCLSRVLARLRTRPPPSPAPQPLKPMRPGPPGEKPSQFILRERPWHRAELGPRAKPRHPVRQRSVEISSCHRLQ